MSSNLALAPESPPPDMPTETVPTVEEVQSNVRNVMIVLLDDRLRAYVIFNLYGKDLSLTLEGRLRVENVSQCGGIFRPGVQGAPAASS